MDTIEGIQFAYEKGVVHRDIKPENILIKNDVAVIADFGVTSWRDFARFYGLT
jgi:serine/threonine-protein kinase